MRKPRKSPPANYGSNICFECQNACGGCEWSEVDPQTEKIRFAPVPGWTAKPTAIRKISAGDDIKSFHVTACPKFQPMRRNPPKIHLGTRMRPVIATDVLGDEKRYASVTEASKAVYTSIWNICSACKGKTKTAGGYRWRYEEETDGKTKM